ncbi:MAG: hypothetical protein FWE91_09550 [Defluviitaleaceae bacterium]|nr:hypothetical protein [Defluviitaleaceae bacterium]MCL2836853.1 hypothetical protein [Defluviitaleaceae bacterium]
METEKITINLGMVEMGKIDVLVEHGLFSNRSDFIRTAIRERLVAYDQEIRELAKPPLMDLKLNLESKTNWFFTLGVTRFTRDDFQEAVEKNKRFRITVVGAVHIDKRVDTQLFAAAVESIKVYGKIIASEEIKELISIMGERGNG